MYFNKSIIKIWIVLWPGEFLRAEHMNVYGSFFDNICISFYFLNARHAKEESTLVQNPWKNKINHLDNLFLKDAVETQLADLILSLWGGLSVCGHH